MALAITGVTLIDGSGAPPAENTTMVFDGDAIASVGQGGGVPGGAEVIDGRGRWAVPGLIDAHVHLELVGRESLPLWLALGVTTLRDLGGALDFLAETRRLLAKGLRQAEPGGIGPRLLFTGPMIDGDPPTWPALVRGTSDSDAAVGAVDEYLAAGADAIKLYTTVPPESLRRCIEHVAGRVPVTGHLGATLASDAMEAGINGLEHALLTPYGDLCPDDMRVAPGETMMSPGFWPKVTQGWTKTDLATDRAKRWIDLLVEKDVSFCPTLTVLPMAGDEPGEGEVEKAPPQVAARWRESEQQRVSMQVPEAARAVGQEARRKLQELVARVHEAGGRIVAGTDTGAIRSCIPGFSLHHELEFLAGAGLSNMEVLRTATSNAAQALRREDLGVVAPGKRADVLLLHSDPLKDVRALRDIERVVHDGRVYTPDGLLAGSETG
jgi:imidazolonepropionase-like amidohydrolase